MTTYSAENHAPPFKWSQASDTMWYQNGSTRTSLIIGCSQEDADRIRNQAFSEHRSLSGYLLHVLERSFWIEDRVVSGLTRSVLLAHAQSIKREHEKVRTAVHLRCTVERAERIRDYAARRRLSISEFVVFSLRRSGGITERLLQH